MAKNTTDTSNVNDDVSFRDRIATVDASGKRKWIYAWKPKGKFYTIRTWLSYIYFIIFFWSAVRYH